LIFATGKAKLEASGNVTLENVLEVAARTGVDYISVGALTHSAKVCFDVSHGVCGVTIEIQTDND
jgi:nicotinate-nucleotide pyrophosphorylase